MTEFGNPPPRTIADLCEEANDTNISKGFSPLLMSDWEEGEPYKALAAVGLIHTEVAEAQEEVRCGNFSLFKTEMADICIRVFTIAGSLGFDLQEEIEQKMARNKERSYRHGDKRA